MSKCHNFASAIYIWPHIHGGDVEVIGQNEESVSLGGGQLGAGSNGLLSSKLIKQIVTEQPVL